MEQKPTYNQKPLLALLPIDIQNYLGTFLIFSNKETDDQLKERLERKKRPLLPKVVPAGTLFYYESQYFQEYEICIHKKNRLFSHNLLHKMNQKYSSFHFSPNNKHLVIVGGSKNIFKVVYLEELKCEVEKKLDSAAQLSHCVIANDGQQIAYVYNINNDKKNIVVHYKITLSIYTDLLELGGTVRAIDFNKQSSKLGILTDTDFSVLDIKKLILRKENNLQDHFIESETTNKSTILQDYFKDKGICKNLNTTLYCSYATHTQFLKNYGWQLYTLILALIHNNK